jgi:predicted Zn-dependent peptidase
LTLSFAVAAVLSTLQAQADVASDRDAEVDTALANVPKPDSFRLSNGLQVIVQPLPWQPRVAVLVSYHAGARDDPPDRVGLAHAVEHMTFRGSRHLDAYAGFTLLEGDGGEVQGLTDLDSTDYVAVVPAFAVPHALWVESERMAFTLGQFSQESWDLERRVIGSEYGLRRSTRMSFEQLVRNMVFGEGHPYARILHERDLGSLELKDIQMFYQRAYRPENALLVVAGGVDRALTRTQVERYFGAIDNFPRIPRADVPYVEPGPAHRRRYSTPGYTQLFAARWLMPNPSIREATSLQLLAKLMNRRFARVLVDGDRAATIRAAVEMHPRVSIFEIDAALGADQSPGPLENALRDEIERIWSSDLTSELEEQKDALAFETVSILEDPAAWAARESKSMTVDGQVFDIVKEVARVRSITPTDIANLRTRFFHPMFAWVTHDQQRRQRLF